MPDKTKKIENDLLKRAYEARDRGESIKIEGQERKVAKILVEKEKLFWSIDTDHVMAYELF